MLSTFLNELDGVACGSHNKSSSSPSSSSTHAATILVIVACSDLDALDSALVRPGRLQEHVHLPYPTRDDLIAIAETVLRQYPVDSCSASTFAEAVIDKMTLAHLQGAWTGADVQAWCRSAFLRALRRTMQTPVVAVVDGANDATESSSSLRLMLDDFVPP